MKLELTNKESEEFFFNSMCNALDYMGGYGLSLTYDNNIADNFRSKYKKENPGKVLCREDVWMGILREGGKLTLIDEECDGEYTKSIGLTDVHNRVCTAPIRHLLDIVNDTDDAVTGDIILQTVFFEDVIFG